MRNIKIEQVTNIFRDNCIACDNRVTPTVDEWNTVAEFVNQQEERIEELVKALRTLRSVAVELDAYGAVNGTFKSNFEFADKLLSKHEANKGK